GDVASGAPPVVALVQAAKGDASPMQRFHPGQASQVVEVARADLEQAVKVASSDDQSPVCIELAERQCRIDHQPPFCPAIDELHPERRALAVAERLSDAVGGLHFDATLANQTT